MLDASAGVEVALRPERVPDVTSAMEGQQVRVPAHFEAEAYAAVLRLLRRRRIEAARAALGLALIARLPAERVQLAGLLAECYALRDRFGYRDVFYVVLARRSSATLLTCDAPLARAAEGYVEVKHITAPDWPEPISESE